MQRTIRQARHSQRRIASGSELFSFSRLLYRLSTTLGKILAKPLIEEFRYCGAKDAAGRSQECGACLTAMTIRRRHDHSGHRSWPIQKPTSGFLGEHSPTALVARPHSKVLQSCQIRCALPVALNLARRTSGLHREDFFPLPGSRRSSRFSNKQECRVARRTFTSRRSQNRA